MVKNRGRSPKSPNTVKKKADSESTWSRTAAFLRKSEAALSKFLQTTAPNQVAVDINSFADGQNLLRRWREYQQIVDDAGKELMSLSRHQVDPIAAKHCDGWVKALRNYSDVIQNTADLHAKVFAGYERRRQWGGDDAIGKWFQRFAGIDEQLERQRANHERELSRDLERHKKILKDLRDLSYRARGIGETLQEKYASRSHSN
jgi:hypothetical protein